VGRAGVGLHACGPDGVRIRHAAVRSRDRREIAAHAPFERQAVLVLEQMKTALEAAGSDLDHVLKCNVLCISAERFKAFNEIYKRYFPKNPPARIFFCVRSGRGRLTSRSTASPLRRADLPQHPGLRGIRLLIGISGLIWSGRVIQDRHRRHKWLNPARKGCVIGMHKIGVPRLRIGESEQKGMAVSAIKAF
jgi:Endoribonuclease L-PSP